MWWLQAKEATSVLANEAKVLGPSELGAEIRLAFDVLNLGLPSDRYDGNALFLYGHLALTWHDDRELEQTILHEARGNFETQPLYDLAHSCSERFRRIRISAFSQRPGHESR